MTKYWLNGMKKKHYMDFELSNSNNNLYNIIKDTISTNISLELIYESR